MRRALLLVLLVAAAGGVLVVRGGTGTGTGRGDRRVDVVFDNARGLVPGQLVEVAGGRVGTITAVAVTPDFKARIELRVDEAFAGFRQDATCTIRAQGLLAENYVQCDPGTAAAPQLRGRDGRPPTVPVTHTSEPVSLSDLFNVWTVPTAQRLGVLISQLGIGTGARGEDVSAILRRANPALTRARRIITLLEGQRADLLRSVDATGVVARDLARHREAIPALVRRSARVLRRTGRHAGDLDRAVARLPALLRTAQPALQALDTVTVTGRPLLAQLHRAAPDLTHLSADIGPLAAAARPTLAALGPVLDQGAGIVRRAAPLTRILAGYARQSLPSARLSGTLLSDLRDQGFITNLLQFFYNAASATARFDSTSHLIPAHISLSQCSLFAASAVSGCRATYTDTGGGVPTRRRAARRPAVRGHAGPGGDAGAGPMAAAAPAGPQAPASGAAPSAPAGAPAAGAPVPAAPTPSGIKGLMDWLLG